MIRTAAETRRFIHIYRVYTISEYKSKTEYLPAIWTFLICIKTRSWVRTIPGTALSSKKSRKPGFRYPSLCHIVPKLEARRSLFSRCETDRNLRNPVSNNLHESI